jgi:molecular chaperone DnaK
MGPVRQALSDAGISASQLDKILLVGGSSRIPAVQDAVKGITGKNPFKGINPDECVASGAAIQGACWAATLRACSCSTSPRSLSASKPSAALHSHHRAQHHHPYQKSQVFSTAADGQTSVEIHVLQGEREMARDNKTLGMFKLDGSPGTPWRTPDRGNL